MLDEKKVREAFERSISLWEEQAAKAKEEYENSHDDWAWKEESHYRAMKQALYMLGVNIGVVKPNKCPEFEEKRSKAVAKTTGQTRNRTATLAERLADAKQRAEQQPTQRHDKRGRQEPEK